MKAPLTLGDIFHECTIIRRHLFGIPVAYSDNSTSKQTFLYPGVCPYKRLDYITDIISSRLDYIIDIISSRLGVGHFACKFTSSCLQLHKIVYIVFNSKHVKVSEKGGGYLL